MSSKDKSTPSLSNSAGSEFNSLVYPSKIFNVDKYSDRLDLRLNCSISALTDPARLGYTEIVNKALSVLTDPDIAAYQDKLLKEAIRGISAGRVDIDYLDIGLKLTSTDIDKLIGKVSNGCKTKQPERGIGNFSRVKTKQRQARLAVQQVQIGIKNGWFKSTNKKPYFTHKFRLTVDNDSYRYMDIYIADPKDNRNKQEKAYNCVIEFIPTRLTPNLISFMLYQIQSVLGPRRYQQLFEKAILLRIDTGYIMHGLSQLFCFPLRVGGTAAVGTCIPDNKSIVETTYLGSRKSKSHDIVYDKVLKELKLFLQAALSRLNCDFSIIADYIEGIDNLFTLNAASTRLETRQFLYRRNPPMLSSIDQIDPMIHRVMFLRPTAVASLNDSQLKTLIGDKKLDKVHALRTELAKRFKSKSKKYLYKFDKAQVIEAFKPELELLKSAIYEPVKLIDDKSLGNYQDMVLKAREYLTPLVQQLRGKQSSEKDIVETIGRCVYVEGSPGAGKTEIIVKHVRHLLKSGVKPSKICILAFTNDAAIEFKSRLRAEHLLQADMFVGTFSSWCNQYLQKVKPSMIIDQPQSMQIIELCIPEGSSLINSFEAEDVARYIFAILSYSINFDDRDYEKCTKKVAPVLVPFSSDIKKIIKSYVKWKHKYSKLDFNDLLGRMKNLLEPEVNKDKVKTERILVPEHILLDEAQDTNAVQFKILKAFHKKGSSIFCVGDPAQSMYGFRGAANFSHRKLKSYFGHCDIFQLVENNRSNSPIVDISNHLRYRINRNYKQSVAKHESTTLPRYKQFNNIKSAIQFLIDDLMALAQVSDGSVMVLCRYNVHAQSVEKALATFREQNPDIGIFVEPCMTYHKSKGKQAEHCYVFDPTFSSYSLGTKMEELCNTYVAFTRAKSHLTILASKVGAAMYGTTDKKKVENSIFAELPDELIKEV